MPFKLSATLIEEVRYPTVDTCAGLPEAGDYTGDIYVVLTATGVWGVNRKRSGMWRSDGVNWNRLGVAQGEAPTAHESTHVSGGSDDIDSALADAAIPNLAAGKITSDRFPVDRLPAMTDEKIWVGTGNNVEERDVPTGRTIATGSYTGNETERQITTGFKCSMVIILTDEGFDGTQEHIVITIPNFTLYQSEGVTASTEHVSLHASDGFNVSDSRIYNDIGSTFYYWAIEE